MEIDGAPSVRASQLEIALIVYGSTMRPDPTRSRSPLVLLLGSSLSHRVLRAASFVNFTRCSILFLSVPLSSLPFGMGWMGKPIRFSRPIYRPFLLAPATRSSWQNDELNIKVAWLILKIECRNG